MALLPTNAVEVARFANALYGLQIGSITNTNVNNDITASGSLTATLNAYYYASFGNTATATVTATLLSNLGIASTDAGYSLAQTYIKGQLDFAVATARGAVVKQLLDHWAGLTTDATYGAAATAWNAKIDSALAYTTYNTGDAVVGYNAGQTFTLTVGVDNVVGGAGNDTIVGGYDAVNSLNTFSGLDNINGGAGNDTLTLTDASAGGGTIDLSAATVTNVEVLNITAVADIVGNGATVNDIDLAAFAEGLTSATLKVGQGLAITVTAETTTSLNVTNDNGVTIIGGGGTLAIDAGAAAVVVGDTTPAATDANAFTSVSVKDGSTVDVTDNSGAAAVVGSKLTTVSLNKNTGAATLTGDGINTVSVTNGAAVATTITNTKAHTLGLTVNNVATGASVVDGTATAVTVTTTGTTAAGKGSLLSLDIAKATSLTVAGAGDITLETTTDDYSKLATVTYTGSGSATADLTGATLLTTVNGATATGDLNVTVAGANADAVAVNVTTGSGDDTVTIDTTNLDTGSTVSLGAGSDVIAVSGGAQIAAGAVVDGGADTDTLALAIVGSANVGAFKNFENFDVAGLTTNFDQSVLNTKNTVADFVGTADTGAALTIQNMGAGVGFIVKGDMDSHGTFGTVTAADVVTLTQATAGALKITVDVDGAEGDGVIETDASFVASNATSLTVTFDNQNVDAVANLAEVNLTGTKATTLAIVSGGSEVANKVDYTGARAADGANDLLTAVTITGDQALTFDYTKVGTLKLASVDASGQTAGGLTFDLADLTSTGTLKLGAGDDVITGVAIDTTASTSATVQTINGLEKGAEAGLAAQDGFDVIAFGTSAQAADISGAAATTAGFSVTDGKATFLGAGPATLAIAIDTLSMTLGDQKAVVFDFAGTTYVYATGTDGQDGAAAGARNDDLLVKLTGTTDVTGLDVAGAGNIYLF